MATQDQCSNAGHPAEAKIHAMSSIPSIEALLQTPFPRSPWRLRADMDLSLFWVPMARVRAHVQQVQPGPALRVVSFFGRALVGSAWVDYGPQGADCVLAYRELLVAVLIRDGWRPRVHITRIWVDSPESLAGGQALWAIPKDMAQFESPSSSKCRWSALGRDGFLAEANFSPLGGVIPVPGFVGMTLLQFRPDGRPVETQCRMRGKVGFARATQWRFGEAAGLRALLGGIAPRFNLRLRTLRIQFGTERE
jgi:hypothetical protein